MATYYYIPSKEALLDAIVEAIIGEIDLTKDDRRLAGGPNTVRGQGLGMPCSRTYARCR
jgi:AcrR family transcriptional regulator